MYCPKCGTSNNHTGQFCLKCGQKLPIQNANSQPSVPQQSNSTPAIPKTTLSISKILKDKNLLKKLELIAGIAGIVGCLLMTYTFFTGFTSISDLFGWGLKSQILGLWYESPTRTSWTFFDDGTFQVNSNIPVEGTFEFVDRNHLRIQVEGLFFFAGSKVWEITISGDTMTLSGDEGTSTFYRDKAKAGSPDEVSLYTDLYNIYIKNIVYGGAAFAKLRSTYEYTQEPKEGWQYCTFDVIIEGWTSQDLLRFDVKKA